MLEPGYPDSVVFYSAADLGMFSKFGRTEAPTKKGPHKRSGKFLHARNNGRPPNEREYEQKRSPVFSERERELNTRGVAEYSDFGPIERYISETVQDRSYVCINH